MILCRSMEVSNQNEISGVQVPWKVFRTGKREDIHTYVLYIRKIKVRKEITSSWIFGRSQEKEGEDTPKTHAYITQQISSSSWKQKQITRRGKFWTSMHEQSGKSSQEMITENCPISNMNMKMMYIYIDTNQWLWQWDDDEKEEESLQ